jgi:hypothetical protein
MTGSFAATWVKNLFLVPALVWISLAGPASARPSPGSPLSGLDHE